MTDTLVERLRSKRENIRETALSLSPNPMPEDSEKTDADWGRDTERSNWARRAFTSNFMLAERYFGEDRPGEITSLGLHAWSQGFEVALDVAMKFIEVDAATLKAQASRIAELEGLVVTLWHDSNSDHGALHECLGMTWEGYGAWVHGKALEDREIG
jgi:hypothetical protein